MMVKAFEPLRVAYQSESSLVCLAHGGGVCVCGNVEGLWKDEENVNGERGRTKVLKGMVQEVEERGEMMVEAFEPMRLT